MLIKFNTGLNSTTVFVTFTADAGVSAYRVKHITVGKNATAAVLFIGNITNVITDAAGSLTTASILLGGPPTGATGQQYWFQDEGLTLDPRINSFITFTWASAVTSSLLVGYDRVRKV